VLRPAATSTVVVAYSAEFGQGCADEAPDERRSHAVSWVRLAGARGGRPVDLGDPASLEMTAGVPTDDARGSIS
jgi:hypothetical protein